MQNTTQIQIGQDDPNQSQKIKRLFKDVLSQNTEVTEYLNWLIQMQNTSLQKTGKKYTVMCKRFRQV